LSQLNRDLLAQGIDKYLTILFAVLETSDNRLRFSNGGHFPTPVLCDEAGARFIDCRGPPIGLFPQAAFEEQTLKLPKGFRLALCSDGVLDALPERNLQAKRERLLAALRPSGSTAENALASLGLAAGNDYPDDITLLIVEQEIQA
jgi:serine phosphatase RsbU (regulator of sigma subunit)